MLLHVREVLALYRERARQSESVDKHKPGLVLALLLDKRSMILASPAAADTFFAGYLSGASLLSRIACGSLFLAPVLGALRHVLLDLDQVLHERESDVQVQHLWGRDCSYLAYVFLFL